jgi:hypothetical protein
MFTVSMKVYVQCGLYINFSLQRVIKPREFGGC